MRGEDGQKIFLGSQHEMVQSFGIYNTGCASSQRGKEKANAQSYIVIAINSFARHSPFIVIAVSIRGSVCVQGKLTSSSS
jgi:hypothetical protein